MKERILILGGTRFFGTALIRELLEEAGDVPDITCFHRGMHLTDFPFPEVSHVIGDRHNRSDVAALFTRSWDKVIDLSGTDWEMISIAMRAAQGKCHRYVFISSSSVYSDAGCVPRRDDKSLDAGLAPQREDKSLDAGCVPHREGVSLDAGLVLHREDEPLAAGTGEMYAVAKIQGERLLQELFPRHTVIRPSKVYGPGNYYFSEWSFLRMLQKDETVVLKNDPVLHFTYIDDLVRGICALRGTDGVFNVAGAEPARLSRFIEWIGDLHGIKPRFLFGQDSTVPFTGLTDRILDLSAAKRAVGWEPSISLREGLKRTFQLSEA